jgi:hypothetical protein
MRWLNYFCWRNTKLVKKNLVVFFGTLWFPFLLLAQSGTDTVPINRDSPAASSKPTRSIQIISSKNYRDSLSGNQKDSLTHTANSRDTIIGLLPSQNKLYLFQQVMQKHPYYNFSGVPVQLVIQEKKREGSELFFYLLLVLFLYYALIRLIFAKYLGDLFTLFFRSTLRQQQLREQLLQSPLPSLLLNILFVLTGSLYASLLFRYNKWMPGTDLWLLWLNCMLVLVVVYLGKFLVLKTMGWVLRISRATDIYLFVVFMVNKMAGIFLLPVLLLLAFPEPQLLPVIISLSLFVLALLLVYRILVSYRLIRNEIKLNLFHFFLYLCAFEIAPLLMIFKVVLKFVERTF